MKRKWKRPLAYMLSVAMVVSLSGTPVYATVGGEAKAGGLCEHHTEHNEDCGYSEGTPCGHEHDEDCYTLVENCTHQHTDECYPEPDDSVPDNEATPSNGAEPTQCSHVCGEDCTTKELNCQHAHDGECGYAEAAPCTFVCEECAAEDEGSDSEESQEAECTCDVLCAEDAINTDCPVCGAEDADLADCKGAEEPDAPVCSCDILCTEDSINADCPVCGVEDADRALCEGAEEIQCVCTEKCISADGENGIEAVINQDCPVCGAEGADLTDCKGEQAENALVQTITSWEWIDEEEALAFDEESDRWTLTLPGVSEANQADFDAVVSMLPQKISAAMEGTEEPEEITLSGWVCESYKQDGEGSWPLTGNYLFIPKLPEGYVLSDQAAALEVTVELGGAALFATATDVPYLEGGEEKTCDTATVVDSNTTAWTDAWYYVQADKEITGRITATGAVHLILGNGATLTASSGISVTDGNSLTIYAQSADESTMGAVTATGTTDSAGIGGGNKSDGGIITINGGTVNATGGDYGAGIGGGNQSGDGGTITINGGTVNATAGRNGAGIGGGKDGNGGTITIRSGTVNATGGRFDGAGIGGGQYGNGGTITISGGVVIATGNYGAAGIGGGNGGSGNMYDGNGGTITISSGTVNATGGDYGAGIGGGWYGNGGTITISGGTVNATGGGLAGAGIGGGFNGNGGNITISGGMVTATGDSSDGAGIGGGRWGSSGTITILDGTVNATGGKSGGAGIGGGLEGSGDTITISGGTVTATGSNGGGAGVGSGSRGDGGTIIISGGIVYATSNRAGSAGIGNGYSGRGSTLSSGESGSAWIEADSIGADTDGFTSGILFNGNDGMVYGSYTLEDSREIPTGKNLTIPVGASLTVETGDVLTVAGTLTNSGTLTLGGENALAGGGTLSGDGSFAVSGDPVGSMIAVPQGLVYTGKDLTNSAKNAVSLNVGAGGTMQIMGKDFDVNASADGWAFAGFNPVQVLNAGTYTVSYTKGDKTIQNTFAVARSGAEIPAGGIETYIGNGKQSDTFTYGEIIAVMVKAPQPTGIAPMTFAAPTANQMAVFKGDTQVSDAVDAADGFYIMTIDTTDKTLVLGENILTAKYVGNSNMAGTAMDFTVTVQPKPLTATVDSTVSKAYDGSNSFTGVALTLTGVVSGDTVTATAAGNAADANVGTNKTFTATSVTLEGSHKDYYTLAADKVSGSVAITAKVLTTANVTVNGSYIYTGSAIVPKTEDVVVKIGETTLVHNIDYTYTASGNTDAGEATITVTFKGNYSGTATGKFTIGKADQNDFALTEISGKTYGDDPFALTTTGGSGEGAVSFSVPANNGVLTISDDTATIVGAGTVTVTATKAEDGNYNPATATLEITIAKAAQTDFAITEVTGKKYNDPAFTLTTTGGSGTGAVSFSVPADNGVLTVSGDTATIVGAGTVTVTATKAEDENYKEATATLEITIGKAAAPSIIWPIASALTYGQILSESTLSFSDNEYGSFAWESGNSVPTVENSGYAVKFTPNAHTEKNYEAITKTEKAVSLTVKKATPAASVTAEVSDGTEARQAVLTATMEKVGGGVLPTGTVTFVDVTNTETTIGTAAVEDGAATFTWEKLAQQEYEVKAVYNGDSNYQTANSEITFDTSKEPQAAFNISAIGEKTYGDGTFTLTATGGSGTGAVTFTSSEPKVLRISGTQATILKAGQVTITAVKSADSQYNEATASVTIIVKKNNLTVTAEDKSIYRDMQLPDFTYTVDGLVNDDSFTDPKIETTANDTRTIGEYPITISGGTLTNSDSYVVTYKDGTLTIKEEIEPEIDGGNSGDNDDSSSQSPAAPVRPDPTAPNTPYAGQTTAVKPDGSGNAAIPDTAVDKAVAEAKQKAGRTGTAGNGVSVTVPVETAPGQQNLNITLKEETLDALVRDGVKRFTISTGNMVSLSLDANALKALNDQTAGDIILRVNQLSSKALSKEMKKAVGTRPVYDISLWYVKGGVETRIAGLNGAAVSISIPYLPTAGETTGTLFAVYMQEKGKPEWLARSVYDAAQNALLFASVQFGTYGVGYTALDFTDIKTHWAKEDILFAASRGLFSGVGKKKFGPDEGVTRGMLVTALGRLEGIDPDAYKGSVFADVAANSEAAPYINWAVQSGILTGTTATTFSPELTVSREQLAVILNAYAARMGYVLPRTQAAATYVDQKQISSWARDSVRSMQQAGVVFVKAGDCYAPYSPATRAEAAAMLRRFVEVLIDPQTANV